MKKFLLFFGVIFVFTLICCSNPDATIDSVKLDPPWGNNPPLVTLPPLTNADNLPEPNTSGFPFKAGDKFKSLEYNYYLYDNGNSRNSPNQYIYEFEFKENNILLLTIREVGNTKDVEDQYEFKYSPKADENAFYIIPKKLLFAVDPEASFNGNLTLADYDQISQFLVNIANEEAMKNAMIGSEVNKKIYQELILTTEYEILMVQYPELNNYYDEYTNTFDNAMPEELKALVKAVETKVMSMNDNEIFQYSIRQMITEYYSDNLDLNSIPGNVPVNFTTYQKLFVEPSVKKAYNEFNTIRIFKYEENKNVYKSSEDRTNKTNLGGYYIYEVIPETVDTMEEVIAGEYKFNSQTPDGRISRGNFVYYDANKNSIYLQIDTITNNTFTVITGEKIPYSISGQGIDITATLTYKGNTYTLTTNKDHVAFFDPLVYYSE